MYNLTLKIVPSLVPEDDEFCHMGSIEVVTGFVHQGDLGNFNTFHSLYQLGT